MSEFKSPFQKKLHEIIFEADTKTGKIFDVVLIIAILLSVVVVMLDSMEEFRNSYGELLYVLEWFFTVLFTIEYFVRILATPRPIGYMTSFFGVIDLLAILPTYFSLFIPSSRYFTIIRLLRVFRIFRVLKLVKFVGAASHLQEALRNSKRKIAVFIFAVLTITVVVGSLMYVVEGAENGFTSIPTSIYWAIVTLTTVGYGDVSPGTPLGQIIAAIVMILGYGIIAVPTGIVTLEMSRVKDKSISTQVCPHCSAEGHDVDASHCKFCGSKL